MAKKIYTSANEELKVLNYIESTGTQYIDTGVIPSGNTRIIAKMEFTSATQTEYAGMFGAQIDGSNTYGYTFTNIPGNTICFKGSSNYMGGPTYAVNTIYEIDCSLNVYTINGTTYTNTDTWSQDMNETIYIWGRNSAGTILNSTLTIAKLYYFQIYQDNVLVRDFVPILDRQDRIYLYDKVSQTKFYNQGTGDFVAGGETGKVISYINKAKKVKKIYVGINNFSKKVKKGYIGVNGKAKQFFSIEKELNYYGTITPVSVWKQMVGKGNIGDYAIIGGGSINGTYSSSIMKNSVEAYNKSLVKSSPTSLSQARRDVGFCSTPTHVIFAGGDPYNDGSTNVDAYNSSLVRNTASHGTKLATICGGTVGQYGVMAGGQLWNEGKPNVYAYSNSLSRSTLSDLNASVIFAASASVGNYVLIGGGSTNGSIANATNKVTAYNSSLTKSTPSALKTSKCLMGGASLNNYALFLGGSSSNGYETVVEVYNSDLVKTTPISVSTGFNDRQNSVTTSNGEYIACLNKDGIIDIIDKNLVKTSYAQDKYTGCISGIFIGNYLMHIMCDSTTEVNTYIIQE